MTALRNREPNLPRLYVVEFRHSLGWTPIHGHAGDWRTCCARMRDWRNRSPSFKYRIRAYRRVPVTRPKRGRAK